MNNEDILRYRVQCFKPGKLPWTEACTNNPEPALLLKDHLAEQHPEWLVYVWDAEEDREI